MIRLSQLTRTLTFMAISWLLCLSAVAQDSAGQVLPSDTGDVENAALVDSTNVVLNIRDTIKPMVIKEKQKDTTLSFFLNLNPDLPLGGSFFYRLEAPFKPASQDHLIYLLGGALLVLGTIRVAFSKYFSDLVRIFSQTAIRQKSIREQLIQNRLASLLMNLFFCFSAGTFLFQLALYKNWLPANGIWWQQLILCIGFVAAVYLVKYLATNLSGWLFGLSDLADTYTFMVFLVNKIVGIMLLPATIAIALGVSDLKSIFMVASLFGLGFLFLYRYVLAIPLLRQHVKIIPIHFFLYFCAFEIVPVLVIYKLMLTMIVS